MNERLELISKLQKDVKFRAAYIRSKLNLLIPSQLRGLRLKGNTTQKHLADEAEMKQPRISAMERPGEIKFSLETLIRMAAAHKVGLQVKFVPFSEMLHWENGYRQDSLEVRRLEQDEEFLNPGVIHNENESLLAEPAGDDSNEAASQATSDSEIAETRKPMAKAEAKSAFAGFGGI